MPEAIATGYRWSVGPEDPLSLFPTAWHVQKSLVNVRRVIYKLHFLSVLLFSALFLLYFYV